MPASTFQLVEIPALCQYLKVSKGGMTINSEKVEESRFDSEWDLCTNNRKILLCECQLPIESR